jgi:D-arabinose 1-dehydrogenase-like Zn-dependent alcohol dehydrogenase
MYNYRWLLQFWLQALVAEAAKQQHFYVQVADFAHKMGADEAIVVGKGEITQAPSSKLDILSIAVPAALDWVPYIDFLNSDGALAFVGVPDAPLRIPLFSRMAKRRRIMASPIGGRAMINQMLAIA